jgi:hypothetical protein
MHGALVHKTKGEEHGAAAAAGAARMHHVRAGRCIYVTRKAHASMYIQWVTDQDERYTEDVDVDYTRVGYSLVRYDYERGRTIWISGNGGIGYQDGSKSDVCIQPFVSHFFRVL